MDKLLECIPNFSEGRDQEKIEAIVEPFRREKGVKLLDYSADGDHNRLVVTIAGSPEALKESVLTAVEIAVELIDMRRHRGEHPRLGAVDVIPFVPLRNTTMEDAVELACEVGREAAVSCQLPVYLYEEAATSEQRRNLADIRRGEFEGFSEKIKEPAWQPDFGPAELHPTAGALVVGARRPLVAFNVNLNTSDLEIANSIARRVRHSGGGLRYCKAIGVELKERQAVQVSMNMTDYTRTALYQAFEMIRMEAHRYGVEVTGSELIGLLPARALLDTAGYYLSLEDFSPEEQVMEYRLLEEL